MDDYIQKHGIDITKPVYQGVVKGTWYSITRGQVFDRSRQYPRWQNAFYIRLGLVEQSDEARDHFLSVYAHLSLIKGVKY